MQNIKNIKTIVYKFINSNKKCTHSALQLLFIANMFIGDEDFVDAVQLVSITNDRRELESVILEDRMFMMGTFCFQNRHFVKDYLKSEFPDIYESYAKAYFAPSQMETFYESFYKDIGLMIMNDIIDKFYKYITEENYIGLVFDDFDDDN